MSLRGACALAVLLALSASVPPSVCARRGEDRNRSGRNQNSNNGWGNEGWSNNWSNSYSDYSGLGYYDYNDDPYSNYGYNPYGYNSYNSYSAKSYNGYDSWNEDEENDDWQNKSHYSRKHHKDFPAQEMARPPEVGPGAAVDSVLNGTLRGLGPRSAPAGGVAGAGPSLESSSGFAGAESSGIGLLAHAVIPMGGSGGIPVEDPAAETALQKAKTLTKMGAYAEAAAAASAAIVARPNDAAAFVVRAQAYNLAKDHATARVNAAEAVRRAPESAKAHEQLAWALLRQKNFRDALEAANRAAELDPKSGKAFFLRALAKDALGLRRDALADLKHAAALDSRFAARYERAEAGGKIYDPADQTLDGLLGDVLQEEPGRRRPVPWGRALGGAAAAGLAAFALWLLLRPRRRVTLSGIDAAAPAEEPASATLPASAARLKGKYELVRVVGRSGAAEVYEAIDHALDRPVAVKKTLGRLASRGENARRICLEEARAASKLQHPSILNTYDVFEDGADVVTVSELAQGKTLHHRLAEERRLTPAAALEVLRPACRALQFAHDRGLAHRDLRPANIMVAFDGQVKLMDFGVRSGAGSPAYLAPEAEQGAPGKEADVYALGVCLYEMLTGALPFPEVNGLMLKAGMQFEPPSAKIPGLPRAFDELVVLALQPTPALRLKSPAEFLARLEAAAAAAAKSSSPAT